MSGPRVREVPLGAADVEVERRADGSVVLRSPHALGEYPARITERLVHWAREAPDRAFIAQRESGGAWRTLSYVETFARVCAIGQALLDRRLSAARPVAILSENDIEHALLALACMHVGIPYVPVSPAYSLISTDFGKLRQIFRLMTPGLVFAADAERYSSAIAAAVPPETEVVATHVQAHGAATPFGALQSASPTGAVEHASAAVGPDSIAKFLLTSGSTGQPKAVINTQRMLCSNQQMLLQTLPSLREMPPVLVDWLPWNHTAGGNHNFGLVLYNGGTLYIDDGKPLPGQIEKTVRNLRDVAPTIYFNVPRGYEALLPHLREDTALRRNFFSRVGLLQYAGAVLPQPVWKAYEDLAVAACGERILWITGYGATETAPAVMFTNRGASRAGTVGLPIDGVQMKLVPLAGKLEARFRGANITPGYWRAPELTAAAFDEEGYYCTGDALRFLDAADPKQGLEFDGRITEDFKLTTGTWVSVGPLRAKVNAAGSPYIQDTVITGHNRDDLGALVFPNAEACKGLRPEELRTRLQSVFDGLARQSTGSSTRIARVLIMETPPAIDASEITDKGSINQRAVLLNRAALVEELYAEPPSRRVLLATGGTP
ncbi:MAG TPA: feruloyl-CoA synthase [Burkholderiales bacterium]|nr:feruloyl-CoA synthase [Burkholderiales bacterium]